MQNTRRKMKTYVKNIQNHVKTLLSATTTHSLLHTTHNVIMSGADKTKQNARLNTNQ